MLFQAEESVAPNAQLEINLVLPAEIAGLAAAEVVCRGRSRAHGRPGVGYREPDVWPRKSCNTTSSTAPDLSEA